MVSYFIEKGASINHRDARGETVLFLAIKYQSLRMATELLEHGAEHDLKDFSGRTPLSWAAEDHSNWIEGSVFKIAKLLIDRGANVHSMDCNGRTPLVYATSTGCWDTAELLIRCGAPVNSTDPDGHTALSHAAEDGKEQVVHFLMQQSAQVDSRCDEMRTPLSYAARRCRTSHIKMLIDKGAAVDSSDWRCNAPLMYSAQVDIDRARLDAEAKHPMDLFYYVKIDLIRSSIEVLLDLGADPSLVNEDEYSPLLLLEKLRPQHFRHITEEQSKVAKEDIKQLLRRYGAEEIKSPTSSDVLREVVIQLTTKLIEIVKQSEASATMDYQVAINSSIHLFRQWTLHPAVSSRVIQNHKTIEHDITDFVQSHTNQDEQAIDKYQSVNLRGSGRPEANANKYGGLSPTQDNGHCSYFLCRLAKLQQRLFNVNGCLYYVENNPQHCSETIDELITTSTGLTGHECHDSDGRRNSGFKDE